MMSISMGRANVARTVAPTDSGRTAMVDKPSVAFPGRPCPVQATPDAVRRAGRRGAGAVPEAGAAGFDGRQSEDA